MKNIIFKNIDNAPLIVFRILFGFLIAAESFGAIFTGWVYNVLIKPQFTFSFIGFEWLQPLPNNLMYVYFAFMGVCGLFIMIGFRYRISTILFTILWAGVYFMQKTSYNNHYYLLLLIAFIMIFLPANKYASLDVKYKYTKQQLSMPYWISLVFIIQITFVYVYAAIAKIYPDWLNGTFTKNLLSSAPLFNTINSDFFRELFAKKWFYLFIAYAGIFFDLLIVPFLLFKRTRLLALIASLIFHLFNSITLQIGIFPYFALCFALFFYEPDFIRRKFLRKKPEINHQNNILNFNNKKLFLYFFVPYLIIQLLLPLRHYLIKGDVLWTEEGHRLSWRMMLRERTGTINIYIVDNNSGKKTRYNHNKNLTQKQANALATKPDYIWQYCQKIKEEYKNKNISIYIDCQNSINRKEFKTLINPTTDFAKAKWNYFFHNDWIILHE